MRQQILKDFDRLDPNLVKSKIPEHIIVLDSKRGSLNLDRDVAAPQVHFNV